MGTRLQEEVACALPSPTRLLRRFDVGLVGIERAHRQENGSSLQHRPCFVCLLPRAMARSSHVSIASMCTRDRRWGNPGLGCHCCSQSLAPQCSPLRNAVPNVQKHTRTCNQRRRVLAMCRDFSHSCHCPVQWERAWLLLVRTIYMCICFFAVGFFAFILVRLLLHLFCGASFIPLLPRWPCLLVH